MPGLPQKEDKIQTPPYQDLILRTLTERMRTEHTSWGLRRMKEDFPDHFLVMKWK